MVRSHLEYAETIWNPHKIKYIEALEKVQRRATKIIPSLGHLKYEQRLRELKLPTLVYRRMRGDMIETYKICHGNYDSKCSSELKRAVYLATRGHKYI